MAHGMTRQREPSSAHPATRPVRSGEHRRRLVRHHLPLALASVGCLALFLAIPAFDADAYPHVDLVSGALPQPRERSEGGPMEHTPAPGHGAGESPAPGHGRGESTGRGHSAGATATPIADHSPAPTVDRPTPTTGHRKDESSPGHGGMGPTRSGEMTSMGGGSFLGLSTRDFTVATGYVATGLLGLTLLIGPANLVLRRRNPVSSYLRRDVGTWTAVFSVIHVLFGLQVHAPLGDFLDYFLSSDGRPLTNSFGLANWTGLAATVVVVGLLALSSDLALRKLKARLWKRLQRLNYALFGLVVVHALFYGTLLRTESPYTVTLVLGAIAVFVGQAAGIWLWRRMDSRKAARPA